VGHLRAVVDSKADWRKRLDEAKQAMDNVFPGPNGMKYRIGKKIGEGSFGIVYDGEMLSDREWVPVALKFVRALLSMSFSIWTQSRAHIRTRNHGRLTSLSYGTSTETTKSFTAAVRHLKLLIDVL
jgi:tetrahydromethanopterin S-methyltransferase subunit G